MKYLGIIIDRRFNFKTYREHSREMYKDHSRPIEVSQKDTETRCSPDYIRGSNIAHHIIRSADTDRMLGTKT